jgi:L-ascorbate metabolism protein UlaG (beta-lactamase superfamily)
MKIQWLGHSSFLITSDEGIRIVTDPYKPKEYLRYRPLNQPADVVTISHDHSDHNYVQMVSGQPIIVKGAGEFIVSGIEFYGVPTMHDASGGSQRGKNTIFFFTVNGVKMCHLGDLGHVLNPDQAAEIGVVDVLLTPIGGYYTIDPEEAWEVADQLAAKIVIPMHFKTESADLPIAEVDEFLKNKPNIRQLNSSVLELRKEDVPEERQIIVLKHAL